MAIKKEIQILVIDDDAADRFLYSKLLSQIKYPKYSIIEASSGEEALDLYEKYPSDCVLLDFMIPNMNGIEFLETIHKKKVPLLPTIFISGHLNPIIVKKAYDLGAKINIDKSSITCEILNKAILSSIQSIN